MKVITHTKHTFHTESHDKLVLNTLDLAISVFSIAGLILSMFALEMPIFCQLFLLL